MTTITDLRSLGSELVVASTPLQEPISAPSSLISHLDRFKDNYDLSTSSHLFRFLVAVCGDAGAGFLKRELLYGKLQQQLASTNFSDLDLLYGTPLGLPRLSTEIYSYDPRDQVLTQAQWQEVRSKDAAYRARSLTWMRAVLEGSTVQGMKLAAEAALGVECDIFERYKWIENLASDAPITLPDLGITGSPNEFVVVPQAPMITDEEYRRCVRLMDRLRPTNTLPTIETGTSLRLPRDPRAVEATSEYFQVKRLVTGREDVAWPDVDLNAGYWIETTEKEAPSFAFMDRQENVTVPTIQSVTATSEHVGDFNKNQRQLFAHLASVPLPGFFFSADLSYARTFAAIGMATPWTYGYQASPNKILVNGNYPIGYFAIQNVVQDPPIPPEYFWASTEDYSLATEELIFNLGTTRPVNFIDFDICQKPIDVAVYYQNDAQEWELVAPNLIFDDNTSVVYLSSDVVPWHYFEYHFDLVQTQSLRIVFTRRAETFPFYGLDDFPWSIEVRNLRIQHVISDYEDFVPDQGYDILGNSFITDISTLPASNVLDGDSTTFWQSQPNPSPLAVEALYFDIRVMPSIGTMAALDIIQISSLDTRGMSDIEIYYSEAQTVDEIFLDPVTIGGMMHIYYSDDDTPDWDNKLWTPIPKHYPMHKGFHAFPNPVTAKYFKLEFSRLPAAPYNTIDYPTMAPVEFRRYPSWVQDYFNNAFMTIPADTLTGSVDRVTIDPIQLGFVKVDDLMHRTSFATRRSILSQTQNENEISSLIKKSDEETQAQQDLENQINFNSIFVWQSDLSSQLDNTRALSRFIGQDDTLATETSPPASEPITIQSTTDLTAADAEKKTPIMWFPRKTRHQYQLIRATRTEKLAFFMAIREVGFYRRDYTQQFDEHLYIETLDDTTHIQQNEFINTGWRYEVGP